MSAGTYGNCSIAALDQLRSMRTNAAHSRAESYHEFYHQELRSTSRSRWNLQATRVRSERHRHLAIEQNNDAGGTSPKRHRQCEVVSRMESGRPASPDKWTTSPCSRARHGLPDATDA